MKKITLCLIILLVVMLPVLGVDAAKKKTTTTTTTTVAGKKVNFYLFYGSSCPHCLEMHEFLAELEEDPTINYMFEIKEYEVWNDAANNSYMIDIATELGYEEQISKKQFGVPFYIIGEYHTTGYAESSNDRIREEIIKAYKNTETLDLVEAIGMGTYSGDRDASESKKNRIVGYVILGVAAVFVVAVIVFSKNNTTYYDEDEDDEDEEEIKAVEKKEVKKTTTKNTTTKKKTNTKKKN